MKKYMIMVLALGISLNVLSQGQNQYCNSYAGCSRLKGNSIYGAEPLKYQLDVGSAFEKDSSVLDFGPDQIL